ncbi:9696_t:CDS:2, partial [Paraglomus occultum]
IRAYFEATRPAKLSYNNFLYKNKPLIIEQADNESWSIQNGRWKKRFMLIAQELISDETIIEKYSVFMEYGVTFPALVLSVGRFEGASASDVLVIIHGLQNEKASRNLWVQIENMQSSRLIEEKRNRIKRKVDLRSVDIFDKSTTSQGDKIMKLYDDDNPKKKLKSTAEDFQSDSDSFSDLSTVGSEESSTDIQYPPIESEESSSVLENLENKNRLATTYKVVSLFDRQFPYTEELYNTFPDQMITLANKWKKVEANIKKTVEERWNVSQLKELVDKYHKIIVDHFDELLDVDHEELITMFSKPPYGDFSYKRDDELIWCQRIFIDLTRQFLRNRGALFDKEACELRYRSEIVNPLLAGVFEMTERSIWLETGEIENEIQKMQRNDTKEDKERSKLGIKHDGVINMIIHGKKYQIGFLEVVGNAFNKDITDRNIELEKLYKAMSLSLWNQRAHLDIETSQQLSTFAVLVHGKNFNFLSMHCINNMFVVKNYDDFILPTTNECLMRIPKIIEMIVKFKIRITIYHREHMASFYKVVRSPSDNPPNASPQKKRNNGGHL